MFLLAWLQILQWFTISIILKIKTKFPRMVRKTFHDLVPAHLSSLISFPSPTQTLHSSQSHQPMFYKKSKSKINTTVHNIHLQTHPSVVRSSVTSSGTTAPTPILINVLTAPQISPSLLLSQSQHVQLYMWLFYSSFSIQTVRAIRTGSVCFHAQVRPQWRYYMCLA